MNNLPFSDLSEFIREKNNDLPAIVQWLEDRPDYFKNNPEASHDTLDRAIRRGDIDIIMCLIQHGLDVNVKNAALDNHLLLLALSLKKEEVAICLIDQGASIHISENGSTPLIWACMYSLTAVIHHMIQKGVDINALSPAGETALMISAQHGKLKSARALVEAGADVKVKNKGGQTALEMAQFLSQKDKGQMYPQEIWAGVEDYLAPIHKALLEKEELSKVTQGSASANAQDSRESKRKPWGL